MINELNETGLAAIAELQTFIFKSGFQLDDRITFDNNQRSIVRVYEKNDAQGNEKIIFESYFPIEVFRFLKTNGYLKAA